MFDVFQNQLGRTLKALKGQAKIRPDHIEEALQSIRQSLLEADVQYGVVQHFLERVKQKALGAEVLENLSPYQQFLKILSQEMLELFGQPGDLNFAVKPPAILLMAGLQGSGKTTSSVKLAVYYKKKVKRKPLLVSVDVYRPAAIEQLQRLAADAKIDYFQSPSMQPLERAQGAIKYAQTYGLDLVIVDTAGRLSIDETLMKELVSLHDELKPHAVLYVVDSMSGQQGLQVAEGFAKQVGLTGAMLTKTDGDTRGGVAFSIRAALGVPIQFVGTGEKIDALEPFYPNRWISRILGMGDIETLLEKAQDAGGGEVKVDQAKRMMKGQFTLRDFQEQMKMMSKMGSLGGLMKMIPGMGAMASKVNPEMIEKRLKRVNAMIDSMTFQERTDPDILNGGRRRRIAMGSGTQVEELNQFIREFYEMQKLMKRFGSGKMKGMPKLFG